jgi:hypothetical protein
VDSVDIYERIMDKNVILLMCSQVHLRYFPWNFDKLAITSIEEHKSKEIRKITEVISGSKEWMEIIVDKANRRNIPVDSMIKLDATYIYKLKLNEKNK